MRAINNALFRNREQNKYGSLPKRRCYVGCVYISNEEQKKYGGKRIAAFVHSSVSVLCVDCTSYWICCMQRNDRMKRQEKHIGFYVEKLLCCAMRSQ